MPYDSALYIAHDTPVFGAAIRERADDDFRRGERLAVIAGASSLGAVLGFGAAIAFGRLDAWVIGLVGTPLYMFALYFSVATFHDACERRAIGCAIASGLNVGALLLWPASALFFAMTVAKFWIAPVVAITALVLFVSCWHETKRVVYRACVQGVLTSACIGYLGFLAVMGA